MSAIAGSRASRASLWMLAWAAVWPAGLTGCGSARTTERRAQDEPPAREDLPPASWRVVARRDGKVLLAAQRVIPRGIRRRVEGEARAASPGGAREYPSYRTLVFENGRLRDGPVARADMRVLPAGETPDTLHLYSVEFEGRPVLFAQAGEGPQPHESPSEPGVYVVERGDRLWLLSPDGVTQLTADTVRGVARDTLRSQQREGVRHLFWATSPLWSADGSAVAYVTNRTWMLGGLPGGNEVWLAEVRPHQRERPLLSERGEFFVPKGWLGPELVYEPQEGPISAVDARTGTRRAIAVGAVVAISPSASRLLYMTSVGDAVFRAHVLTERGVVVDVPDPAAGERLSFGGTFSPSGNRLALGASFARDSGATRALYVFDLRAKRLTRLAQWTLRESGRHADGAPAAWLDDSALLVTQFDRATGAESSTLLRLKGSAPPRRKN